jgi:hypothetical protein
MKWDLYQECKIMIYKKVLDQMKIRIGKQRNQ